MKTNRRHGACLLLVIIFAFTAGCSKNSPPTPNPQQAADEQNAVVYRKLVEESKARVAAAAASAAAAQPKKVESERADPYQIERWLSNLGYQRNLAARIRQDINLFALLVPEMAYFSQAGKYDKAYLAAGLLNKPLVDLTSNALAQSSTTRQLSQASMVLISDPFRTFIIDFSSSFYEGPRFLKFLSEPLNASKWRVDAILKLNQLTSFDRTQALILSSVAPVLLSRFPVKDQQSRIGLAEKLAATLALYRTAWALKDMSDDEVYRLVIAASAPDVVDTFSATANAVGAASKALAADMNAFLPATLASKSISPLASLGQGSAESAAAPN